MAFKLLYYLLDDSSLFDSQPISGIYQTLGFGCVPQLENTFFQRSRNVSRSTEGRLLNQRPLVHMSVNSSQDGSNLFIQIHEEGRRPAGTCDRLFLPMNHWGQDACRTQSGLFRVPITISILLQIMSHK